MLLGIAATIFVNCETPSSGSRGRTQKMNKKLISSCYYGRFPLISAVIRCYFRRQNPKLTIKSTCCLVGGANFPVLTANAAGIYTPPFTPNDENVFEPFYTLQARQREETASILVAHIPDQRHGSRESWQAGILRLVC